MLEGIDGFTSGAYRELLTAFRAGNRKFCCFGDFRVGSDSRPKPTDGFVLVRHDIDFLPEYAIEMAELEAALDVRSTYFLQLTCSSYNLLCARYIDFAKRLVSLGHEVGLHYELGVIEKLDAKDPVRILEQQADLLGLIAGKRIESISMHAPSLSGADPFRNTRFVNAYDAEIAKEIPYFSDSAGGWRDAAHAVLTSNDLPPRFQFLVHPLFWRESPGGRVDRLDAWAADRHQIVTEERDEVDRAWKLHTGVIEHDARLARQRRTAP